MSQTSTHKPGAIDATAIWEALSQHIDAFVSAWEGAGEPPPLGDFVPPSPPSLRSLTLVELIKIDLEYRWQGQRWPKQVEVYVTEFPELAEGGVPCDIIYEEFHIRKQQGEAVSVAAFCERFPEKADELKRLCQLEAPDQTSTLVPAEKAPTFAPGERIDDFDLLLTLGKGAFATVFLAKQLSMQRLVALKVSRDRGFEHQTLAQLEHPHIVRVFDQRQLVEHKLRLLYMQFVPGGTLQGVLEHARETEPELRGGATLLAAIDAALAKNNEQAPLDSMTRYKLQKSSWSEVVCWLGARLAGALEYAHKRGVLHRDVKPANVLVGPDGHPRLADFNISFSKLDGATPAAYFGGSLAYMSPEQLEACDPSHGRQPDELDGRSDVYSLGVMLWELLTMARPFDEKGLPQTWSQVLPKMTTRRRTGVPPEAALKASQECSPLIIDVLLKCLEPEPSDRYANAGELARELELCLQPRAHALMHKGRSWTSIFKRYPVATTIALGLLPNIVMCTLNIVYNVLKIVRILSPEDQSVFLVQTGIINAVAYTIALSYVAASRWQVFGVLTKLARGMKVDPPPTTTMVRRCLSLGMAVAIITAILWSTSGFVFPAWMEYGAGPNSKVTADHYQHFFISNTLCGLIAATQTYYMITFASVRCCYPWLLRARSGGAREIAEMATVSRRGRWFLALAVSVPFLAIFALAATDHVESNIITALGGIGLLGCGLAYWLDLTIRGDLAALAGSVNPGGDALGGGDSFESLLTGSNR